MKTTTLLLTALSFLSPAYMSARYPQPNEEYTRHIFTDSNNLSIPYRMLSPSVVTDGDKYPLVLFLHGSGERGNDNESQLVHGASVFSNPVNLNKYPAFVVFPQCKEKFWTGKIDARQFMPGAETPPESQTEEVLMNLLDSLIASNPIDPDRIYIIGISMGGIAAYDMACRYPERFAAAVPICGAVNPERLADAKDVKFMIFHGEKDEEIPAICGREAYKALTGAGADVGYIEFAGTGHDCWSEAFNHPQLLPWLFSQNRTSGN